MSNLPKYHLAHQQEAESLKRLAELLPTSRFLLRKEDGGDFGVDRVLEVVENSEATNIRSHIQVKSKKRNKRKDGSIKRAVPIKTIVYLLGNANSLFLVYSLDENQFYWAWVREIALAATQEGVDLEETRQKSFTYHFARTLDSTALDTIHAKLLRDNALLRRIDFDRNPFLRAVLGDDSAARFNELVLLYLEERYEAVAGLASASDLEKPFTKNLVAHSYYQIRNLREALRVITQGNSTSPIDVPGRRTLAIILCEMGSDHRDRAMLVRARETQESIPREAWTWEDHYNFGNMLDSLGEHQEALAQFDTAVELKADVAMVWKNMAGSYFQLGDREKELECLDKALQLDPDLVEALVSKATTIGMGEEKLEEAIALLRRAIRLSAKPHYDNSDFHWWLARFQANVGQVNEALRSVDEALGLYPVSIRLQELRASIVIESWRHSEQIADEAALLLEDFISRNSKLFPARAELIEIYAERGQAEQAKSLLVSTLEEVGFSCAEQMLMRHELEGLLPVIRKLGVYFKYRASSNSLAADFFENFEIKTATYEKIELEFAIHFTRLATIILPGRPISELLAEVEKWVAGFRETNEVGSRLIAESVAGSTIEAKADLVARVVMTLPELTLRELSRQLGWLLATNGYRAEERDAILEIELVGEWLSDSIELVLTGAHEVLRRAER